MKALSLLSKIKISHGIVRAAPGPVNAEIRQGLVQQRKLAQSMYVNTALHPWKTTRISSPNRVLGDVVHVRNLVDGGFR